MRKVLHQDGASQNVTKLFAGRADKLRLGPFYLINAAQVAPRAKQRQTHQMQVDKTLTVLLLLPFSACFQIIPSTDQIKEFFLCLLCVGFVL